MLHLSGIELGTQTNILAKINYLKPILPAKRSSDHYQSLSISDDTLSDISLTCFFGNPESFPTLKIGDIIYCQAKFTTYYSKIQGIVQKGWEIEVVNIDNVSKFNHVKGFQKRFESVQKVSVVLREKTVRMFKMLQEIRENEYVDLNAFFIKRYSNGS